MYIHKYTYIRIYINTHVCIFRIPHPSRSRRTYVPSHLQYIHIHIYTHTHALIHVYIHANTLDPPSIGERMPNACATPRIHNKYTNTHAHTQTQIYSLRIYRI